MSSEKYVSMKKSVNGFSFANLGFFYGFGNAIINAVYSLVLFDIFQNSSIVGVYTSLSYGLVTLLALSTGEFFRRFTKTRIFYVSILTAGIFAFMMAFSIKPVTFIVLDQLSRLPWLLIGYSIPLFLADFSKDVGMNRLSGRYYTWLNIGAALAPIIAMFFAENFGNRSAYFVTSAVMFIGFLYYGSYHLVSQEKPVKKLIPKRTVRSILNNVRLFFKNSNLRKAYLINCGYFASTIISSIYIPIIIVGENGFSKEVLGYLLAACTLPYIFMATIMPIITKKIDKKICIAAGFLISAVLAVFASFVKGYALLGIFVAWDFARAMIEPLRDLLFFESVNKFNTSRLIGVYKTGNNVPRFIFPMVCAGVIAITGVTSLVWIVSAIVAVISAIVAMSYSSKK
ncbi:MAG: MFS transporter [Alphaproteobacteria bacterium]|jgi:MFS family permease|nr:MFS transporter [Alphaproteobacteria bacterium]